MTKKVILNTYVNPDVRQYVKVAAAQQGITMATLLERMILKWKEDHQDITKLSH